MMINIDDKDEGTGSTSCTDADTRWLRQSMLAKEKM